jgi:hypothetical protein
VIKVKHFSLTLNPNKQKKKVESTIRHQTTANSEMFAPVVAQRDLKSENPVPLSGQMGDRSRGLFEIRIPKIIIRNLNFNVKKSFFI